MKAMCPPGYHHNDFVATYALGHMMYGYTLTKECSTSQASSIVVLFGSWVPTMCNRTSCAQVHELLQSHRGDNWGGGTLCEI